jgi:hypothetical protein
MDPISSTYGSSAAAVTPAALLAHQQDAAAKREETGPPVGKSPPATSSATMSDGQLGIKTSGKTGDEFHPYGPQGQRQNSRPTASAAAEQKDTQPAPTDKAQQEDPAVQQVIAQLKSIEAKVKAHEAAHKAAGGAATGPVSYSYTRGPDGKNYITGGEVPITISSGRTPQETISRMQQVIQAALAPADPSPQDRAVAAQAAAIQQTARQEQTSILPNGGANISQAPPANGIGPLIPPATVQYEDSIQQIRRAYSNPAVTGKEVPSTRDPQNGMNLSGSIPSPVTGFSPPRLVSVYH